ncbi:MAG: transcription-repair coupling factor, partial [Simkaniaceae bacterium]
MKESPSIQAIEAAITQEKSLLFEGLWDAPKALIAWIALEKVQKNILIISGGERETRLFDDLCFLTPNRVLAFPAWETLPGEEILPSPDIIGKRFEILGKLLQEKGPKIVLTPLQGILQKVCCPKSLQEKLLTIKQGDLLPFDSLPDLLISLGYRRESIATDKGEFAVRGGILDIFPVASFNPYRLDFFGDEVEEIRAYDPISQKSIGKEVSFCIHPAQELSL